MKFTATVEGFIKFISDVFNEGEKEVITDWVRNNLLNQAQQVPQKTKAAFFEAQRIVFTEYIIRNDIGKSDYCSIQ